jgi:hypothetical protein
MPVRGVKEVQRNVSRLLGRVRGPISEKTMVEVLITGASAAAAITPRDTSTLVNSQYRIIALLPSGVQGRVGFATEYAQAVNDASGVLAGTPRSDDNGNYWDPAGEPDFLRKGFERDAATEIRAVIRRGYKL